MLFSSIKYLPLFLQRTGLCIVLVLVFGLAAFSQNYLLQKDTFNLHLNPILVSAIKNPVKPNPTLNERFKHPNNQLMYWPNYPLTAAQIEARNREWDRNNNLPIGQRIAKDAIEIFILEPLLYNSVNSLIYGRKIPPAKVPKF